MKCPNCETKLSKDDFEIIIYDHEEAEIILTCPTCGNEPIIGFSEKDLV